MSPHRSESCKEIFTLLSEYLDLELPNEACQQITRHLADCPACVEFADSLRRTIDLCRQYRPAEMPGALGQQAREQLLSAYTRMLENRNK
ncbi:MAG TPA: zf-HC2 domain-containing protein [Bryobacteraceae bacterium]|nr:zf-HC2 domain-containing protein [Bryobacteraceae bacterium]